MDDLFNGISFQIVEDLYNKRINTHYRLLKYLRDQDTISYTNLALAIDDPSGNYSAHEHNLGSLILKDSTADRIFNLADKLFQCNSPNEVPEIIQEVRISYLGISVGSEMALMLRPERFWVMNIRTLWAHLVVKFQSMTIANKELKYFRLHEATPEMQYSYWYQLYEPVGQSMDAIFNTSIVELDNHEVQTRLLKYLWADAIADTLYNEFSR